MYRNLHGEAIFAPAVRNFKLNLFITAFAFEHCIQEPTFRLFVAVSRHSADDRTANRAIGNLVVFRASPVVYVLVSTNIGIVYFCLDSWVRSGGSAILARVTFYARVERR